MQEVHMVAQGKGGMGKTFIASLVVQYLQGKTTHLHCYDTDPQNHSFANYPAFNAEVINILNDDDSINTRPFDDLVEALIYQDGFAVVDNGSATFSPLMNYMAENDTANALAEEGVRLVFHVPLDGGQALTECVKGLDKILEKHNADVIVWLNEHNGKIELKGKTFKEFSVYKANQERILGIVKIESLAADTYGKDITTMTEMNLTFEEVKVSPEFRFAEKRRLNMVKESIFSQLDAIPLTDAEISHEPETA